MKSSPIKLTVVLPGKPNEVFGALTNAKIIAQWNGQKGKVEAKVGGKFEMFDGWVKGKVLEFEPGKTLAYTWRPGDWPEDAQESVVKYSFTSTKRGTKVVLEHSNFPNETEKKNHKSGWMEFVFEPLRNHLSSQHEPN
ncbi:MAG: SRPBCC domain-containing protein [Bacteroidota bacterium]